MNARIIASALFALLVFQPTTANAAASDAEPAARIVYPLAPNNAKSSLVRVQIEGPAADWGVRQFAETLDDRFVGLRIRSHGTCAERPEWACVRVIVQSWTPEEQQAAYGTAFMGLMDNIGYNRRDILLNSYYQPSSQYAVAAHEFGHVLGLNHHLQDGVCGAIPDVTELSWAEDKALRPYYGRLMAGQRRN